MLKYYQLFFAVLAAVAVTSNAKSDFVPLTPVGNVAAVQSIVQDGDARLYYQQSNGAILQIAVTGPFTSGTSISEDIGYQIVPPGQAMLGTPIAACSIDGASTEYSEVCVHTLQSIETLIQIYTFSFISSSSLLPTSCPSMFIQPESVSKVVQAALSVLPSPDFSV